MAVIGTARLDTRVLVGDDVFVCGRLAFDIGAGLGKLCDSVATPMVNEHFASAHPVLTLRRGL